MKFARTVDRGQYRPTGESSATARLAAMVAYDGTELEGWQTQPSGRTVQDIVEARLSGILGAQIYIAGSGRTDAGVHARGQVFHFDLPKGGHGRVVLEDATPEVAAAALQRALHGLPENTGLPLSVRILSVWPAPPDFHARDHCIGKRYVYSVCEGVGSPFSARHRWALGRDKQLDIGRMSEAAALLVGEHDFSSFGVLQPGDTRTVVKRMRSLEVRRWEETAAAAAPLEGEGTLVTITAECDRFLMNMMRIIAGTLVEVGLGRLSVADVATLLEARGRKALARHGGPRVYKAPPRGLCLERCFYAPEGSAPEEGGGDPWMGAIAAHAMPRVDSTAAAAAPAPAESNMGCSQWQCVADAADAAKAIQRCA